MKRVVDMQVQMSRLDLHPWNRLTRWSSGTYWEISPMTWYATSVLRPVSFHWSLTGCTAKLLEESQQGLGQLLFTWTISKIQLRTQQRWKSSPNSLLLCLATAAFKLFSHPVWDHLGRYRRSIMMIVPGPLQSTFLPWSPWVLIFQDTVITPKPQSFLWDDCYH